MAYGLWLIVFVLGTAAGSFLNLVADRLPNDEPITGRSRCPHCRKKLSWFELIPVASFFLLRGRCLGCKRAIPWEHPVIELAAGFLFLLVAYAAFDYEVRVRGGVEFARYAAQVGYGWFVVSALLAVFLSDLKYYIIPDKIILPASAFALLVNGVQEFAQFRFVPHFEAVVLQNDAVSRSPLLSGVVAAGIAAGFFLALIVASQGRWMGLGDVKFGLFMGLVVGWPGIIPAIFTSFFLGSLVALPLVALRRKTMQSFLPFGTFLGVATLIWYTWGWYLNDRVLDTFLGM